MKKYLVISLLTLASPALAYGAEWHVDLADGTLGATCTATDPCLVFNDALDVEMNSLELDPMFVDPEAMEPDFHLQATSPLIDAGYDVTKYKIEYSRKKSFTKLKRVGTTKTKKTLTKLKADTRYFVRVKAIYQTDYAKYQSAKTNAKRFTTKAE